MTRTSAVSGLSFFRLLWRRLPMFQTYSTSDYYDSNSLCSRTILFRLFDSDSPYSGLSCFRLLWLQLPLFQAYPVSSCYDADYPCFRLITLQIGWMGLWKIKQFSTI